MKLNGTDVIKRINPVVAGTLGTTLEAHFFFVLGACAILIFNKTFFVSNDPVVASLFARHHLGQLFSPTA